MWLWHAGEPPPADLAEVLLDLGAGNSRFSGTTFGKGECSLDEFLEQCRQREDHDRVPADLVPQSVYWLMDDDGRTVGIVRVRHWLTERLNLFGGHVAYYVKSTQRGNGYGTESLRLALEKARELGIDRVLITVHPDNEPSTRVVLANGGVPDGQSADPQTGEIVDRFWIEL